ncbi:MAG TPA: peptidylprolyl isomerase [Micromonosporaceae bacterium]
MASSRDRQRKLARAKLERQMARRAARARRRRQIQAGVSAAVVLLLVVLGTVWALGGFDHKKKVTAAGTCAWTPADTGSNPNLKNVGTPPTSGEPRTGTRTMTINTNLGLIQAELDVSKAPCTAASFAYLADKHFFDNTQCHRLTTSGLYVLQCGDPSGTGSGGPGYTFADEYVPTPDATPSNPPVTPSGSAKPSASASASPSASPSGETVTYKRGTLAMANNGPDTNGSQFFIVYKDSQLKPNYTVFGSVVSGLDVVDKVAAAGTADGGTDGKPKTQVTIQTLRVDAPGATIPPATPTPSTPPSASPSQSATTKS